MLKKSLIIALIAIAIGGAYALFHKSGNKLPAYSSNTSASTSTSSGSIIQTKNEASVGSYLADTSGNALYTYGADTTGISNCSGSCLDSWPAYQATSTTNLPTNVSVITRSDGSKQYAYKGLPLYTFISDSPGQVTGNNVSNFHVAKP